MIGSLLAMSSEFGGEIDLTEDIDERMNKDYAVAMDRQEKYDAYLEGLPVSTYDAYLKEDHKNNTPITFQQFYNINT